MVPLSVIVEFSTTIINAARDTLTLITTFVT